MDNMINNQQNTISTLRNKSWYRLLKVVYILAFIAALVMSFSPLMNDYSYVIQNIFNKEVDNNKVVARCNYGNRTKHTLSGHNIFLIFGNSLALPAYNNSAQRNELQKLCDMTDEDINKIGFGDLTEATLYPF